MFQTRAGIATIVDLFCWVPYQEFVLIIYDRIAHVMSILSVHITDVYRLYSISLGFS